MISRTRGIFSGNLWKSKNLHSLEYLKYLYTVLSKNQNISEQNKDLLVEVFRLIAEILIWGDQNDSSVIDFFLEKNISSFFLKYMNQKNGKLICNQLLQTLSIIFENISDNTSIYYLLSNNHINSIICHKFDFSDEEVMGYYISFLKALSMKLNKHTINFFYNEHTNDFALYTEAIKFFNQPESMVRTAVRIITLNVYKVADKPMLSYIREKTAKPYFENLMWFIGNDIITVDRCIRNGSEQNAFSRLQGLVDGHLDHLHYINDILCLNVDLLNDILIDNLLNRLFIPLYVYSLTKCRPYNEETDPKPHINYIVSLFLLSQVFLIIKHPNVVRPLSKIILTGDHSACLNESNTTDNFCNTSDQLDDFPIQFLERKFEAPNESLSETLDKIKGSPRPRSKELKSRTAEDIANDLNQKTPFIKAVVIDDSPAIFNSAPVTPRHRHNSFNCYQDVNIVSSETVENISSKSSSLEEVIEDKFTLEGKPFLKAIVRSLDLDDDKLANDYGTLFALGLVFAICHNQGVDEQLLNSLGFTSKSNIKTHYNKLLIDKLIAIFNSSVKYGSPVRLPTLELACVLVEILVCSRDESFLSDEHYAHILTAHEESTLLLRNYYKSEEVFVDMFEDEFLKLKKKPLNVEFLMMDSKILLPPNSKFHDSGDFNKKLPSTDIERARYAIRVFLLLRQLCDRLKIHDSESVLNLSIRSFNANLISVGEKLDLTHRDIVACAVDRNGKCERRFLVSDDEQIILVEPDSKRVGWGVVTFAGFLQHIKISPIKEDNKTLLIDIYNHASAIALKSSQKLIAPMLSAKFIFDDHIRCMVARKRLEKGREKAQELKLQEIALMLDFPENVALGIKPSLSNNNREYCSGYFGPKDFVSENNKKRNSSIQTSALTINEFDKEVKTNIQSQRISSTSSLSEFSVEKNHFN